MPDWGTIAGIAGAFGGTIGAATGIWAALKSGEANRLSADSNAISKKAVEVAERAFRAEYEPRIAFSYERRLDRTTEPPTRFIFLNLLNDSRVSIEVRYLGVSLPDTGSGKGFPGTTFEGQRYCPRDPFELPAGKTARVPVESEWLEVMLDEVGAREDGEFVFFAMDSAANKYCSNNHKVAEFIPFLYEPGLAVVHEKRRDL